MSHATFVAGVGLESDTLEVLFQFQESQPFQGFLTQFLDTIRALPASSSHDS